MMLEAERSARPVLASLFSPVHSGAHIFSGRHTSSPKQLVKALILKHVDSSQSVERASGLCAAVKARAAVGCRGSQSVVEATARQRQIGSVVAEKQTCSGVRQQRGNRQAAVSGRQRTHVVSDVLRP